MTISFYIENAPEELTQALITLDQLAGGGHIRLRRSITVETENASLALILGQLAGAQPLAAQPGPAPAEPPAPPAPAEQRAPQLPERTCEICGAGYQPVRVNQVVCSRPGCRAAKQRQYIQRSEEKRKAAQEVAAPAQSSPFAQPDSQAME